MTRAAIYARISQDRTGEGLGVDRQRADCRQRAEEKGWDIIGEYVDDDQSAYSGKVRPEYRRLMEDAKAGRVDAILAWHTDRLHRSPLELEDFITIVEGRGIAVETIKAGPIDLATPSGRAVARTLGAWARYESEHKAERVARKHEELASRGEPSGGGTRPFGLTADWSAIVPEETDLIREAAARVIAGDSLRSIVFDWMARGITTPAGNRWQSNVLRRMLTSAHIAGLREHRGYARDPETGRQRRGKEPRSVTRGTWPAIIEPAQLERLRAILRDPSRNRVVNARRYLLAGFLTCGACGARLVSRPRLDKVRRYVCARGPQTGGCGKMAIMAEPTEKLIAEAILYRLDSPDVAAALATDEPNDEEAVRLAEDRAALVELSKDHYVEHRIGREEFFTARAILQARITEAESRLASARGEGLRRALSGAGEAAREAWRTRGFEWQRSLVGAMVDRIEVGPAVRGRNRFDPTRLTPLWRG